MIERRVIKNGTSAVSRSIDARSFPHKKKTGRSINTRSSATASNFHSTLTTTHMKRLKIPSSRMRNERIGNRTTKNRNAEVSDVDAVGEEVITTNQT